MLQIAIPYYSGSGHTRKLASFIKEGVEQNPSVQAKLINVETISDEDWDPLHPNISFFLKRPVRHYG